MHSCSQSRHTGFIGGSTLEHLGSRNLILEFIGISIIADIEPEQGCVKGLVWKQIRILKAITFPVLRQEATTPLAHFISLWYTASRV